MIKSIVFDLGKVLLEFDYRIAARSIAARGKLSPEQIWEVVSTSPLLLRYETGLMTSHEFYREICDCTGYASGFEQFGTCFGDIFKPIEPMICLHDRLRQRGYPTYIFSNTNELAIRHIRRNYAFFANFDGYVLSYEHRCMKPEAGLYEVVERVTGSSGEEILYFDDRPENVAAGAARGWKAVLHETPERTELVVRSLGLLDDAAITSGS
jgi:FMN phosphatase YigB (HAD superfamily)